MFEGTVMIIGMIIGIEIIEGEVGVGVEIGTHVTDTERGIIVVVAGVTATALMITKSTGETGIHIKTSIIFFHHAGLHRFIPILSYDYGQFVSCT
jgi:hypothetical protein